MEDLIRDFIDHIRNGDVEIYDERSLQFRLANFLESRLAPLKCDAERHVRHFRFDELPYRKIGKVKIDIAVLDATKQPATAIELKFPQNGAYPDTMFEFCRDINFIEQLKKDGFHEAFLLILADDPLFYSGGRGGDNVVYPCFRAQHPLHGTICKPPGRQDKPVVITGTYTVEWHTINDPLKYALIEAE